MTEEIFSPICPYCDASIPRSALQCDQCQRDLPQSDATRAGNNNRGLWIFVAVVTIVLAALLSPAFQSARESKSPPCFRNLRSIAFALNNYRSINGAYPPAYVADKDGRPMHSWRVLILPFLDEKPLFEKYDFKKPWDAPENRFVLENMPDVFHCESHATAAPNSTSYAGVFGKGCVFDPDLPMGVRDIEDGETNTILAGTVVGADIPWTKPEDIDVSLHPGINEPGGFGMRPDSCYFAFCGGHTRVIDSSIDPAILDALFRRNDGKPIDTNF